MGTDTEDGPLVVTANHPHGLIDGMVLAELIGKVEQTIKSSQDHCSRG